MLNAIWYLISDFGFGIYSTMSQIEEKSKDTVYVIEINWNKWYFYLEQYQISITFFDTLSSMKIIYDEIPILSYHVYCKFCLPYV